MANNIEVDPNDPRVAEYIEENADRTDKALVVMDNTPVLEQGGDKVTKFTKYLQMKIRDKTGKRPLLIHLPAKDGLTLGCAFIAFDTQADAEEACRALNNFKIDKSHTAKTNMFSEWEKLKDVPDTYEAPKVDMANFSSENLYEYMCDKDAREQFFMIYQKANEANQHRVEMHWNHFQVMPSPEQARSAKEMRKLVHERKNWTNLFAKWSPLGTYFVTFHQTGVKLWGGSDWSLHGEFNHSGVQWSEFSPKENYLITWGTELIVWDVQVGKKIRRVQVTFKGGDECPFKWSHDEQFLMKLAEDNIMVYDMEKGMKIITPDPKRATTLYMPAVRAVEWSPADNYFCFWVPEENNTPARVTLMEVVTQQLADGVKDVKFNVIAQRNLYRVQGIRMTWHPQGDFLACKVERQKKPGQIVSAYELFRIRDKDRAVEAIELPEQVIAFDFEPRGTRFALIHGPSDVKLSVSFYNMSSKAGGVKHLATFKDKKVNNIYWSPRGKYCVLAGLNQPFNGQEIEFWNVPELEMINSVEHFMCRNIAWDPSGRFVTTFVSSVYTTLKTGFMIWTFQGRPVAQETYEGAKFSQFGWRPHPPSVLTDKDMKQVLKNKPVWEKRYSEEERLIENRDAIEARAKRVSKMRDYKRRTVEIAAAFPNAAETRRKLWASTGATLEYREVTEQVEELIRRTEKRISRN